MSETYTTTTEFENKQLRVACSVCNFTVCCWCSNNIIDQITGDLKMSNVRKHMKACFMLFVYMWKK
jgi:hypothetical protein